MIATKGMPPLVQALEAATADDLAAIDKTIEEMKRTLDGLVAMRRVIDHRLNGNPKRTKPKAAARRAEPVNDTNGDQQQRPPLTGGERAERIAKLLLKRGATRPMTVANECGIPHGSISGALQHPWFTRDGDGNVSLSRLGKEAVG